MNARTLDHAMRSKLYNLTAGMAVSPQTWHANTLRRAQLTLHRWAELECGDGNKCIERDEKTDKPFMLYVYRSGAFADRRDPIPDRERGALKRVAEVCKELGLFYYHQTDPRGCALYVSREPLSAEDYSRGVAVC